MRDLRVCAVVPAYNEERHIAEVVRAILERGIGVVVVDDSSSDRTCERARAAGAEVFRHGRNQGKGKALSSGLGWATEKGFDAAVTLDGDGQYDPTEIGKFVDAARAGADIVVGSRDFRGPEMPPARKLTNWFMSGILSFLANRRLTDTQSGYRLIRTDAWQRLGLATSRFDTESEMLVRACRLGMVVREVRIRTIYGDEKSSIRPVRDTVRWVRLVWRLRRKSRRGGPRGGRVVRPPGRLDAGKRV